jgi:hypothetical protein
LGYFSLYPQEAGFRGNALWLFIITEKCATITAEQGKVGVPETSKEVGKTYGKKDNSSY